MSDITRDYSFGGWIKHFRHEAKLTLREAAEKINMDFGNLSKLERNELAPPKSAKRIEEICEAYGKIESAPLIKSIAFQHHLALLKKEFEL